MIVNGQVVHDVIIKAGLKRMRSVSRSTFSAKEIEQVAIRAGCFEADAMRIADRLIQRERKAGNIVRDGRGWRKA